MLAGNAAHISSLNLGFGRLLPSLRLEQVIVMPGYPANPPHILAYSSYLMMWRRTVFFTEALVLLYQTYFSHQALGECTEKGGQHFYYCFDEDFAHARGYNWRLTNATSL